MNKIRTGVIVAFILGGCQQVSNKADQTVNQLEIIDLTDHWTNPLEVKLSAIADSIFYIPLETNPKAFISGDNSHLIRVEFLEQYLVVYEENRTLKLFSKKGKYLLTFGGQGKGPGEYIEARHYVCDESKNRVYILDGNQSKIIVYDFAGKLIDEIQTQQWPCQITVSPDHEIGIVYLSFGNMRDTARLEWLTPEGKLKQKIPLYQNRLYGKTATWGLTSLYWIDGRLRITEPPFDTIHQLDPVVGFKGITSVIAGPEGIPREIWFNSVRWRKEAWNYLIIRRIFENSGLVFIESEGKKFCNFLYQRTSENTICVRPGRAGSEDFNGLQNDLDGGLPFWPRTGSDDYLLTCISYTDIQSCFKDALPVEQSSFPNPLLHQQFIKMARGLKENDNPVVVVVRMKK
jgi:hypothetical protein